MCIGIYTRTYVDATLIRGNVYAPKEFPTFFQGSNIMPDTAPASRPPTAHSGTPIHFSAAAVRGAYIYNVLGPPRFNTLVDL